MNPDAHAPNADESPAGLIGRRCGLSAREWHGERLETSQGDRRRYHARWLAHLTAPADARGLPLVSVFVRVLRSDGLLAAQDSP